VSLRRRQLVLLVAGMVLVTLNLRAVITIVGPLTADIRDDLGLSRSVAGLLTTAPLLAFGLVSPLAPRLAARIGSDRALVAAMLVMTAGLLVRPLPPLALLFLGTLAAGCGAAIANVLLPALIKRHFAQRAAFMVATYSVVLGIGAALAAGFAVPSMEWLGDSWRAALALWAIPALAGALAWLPQARAEAAHGGGAGPRVHVNLWRDPIAWQVTGFLAFLGLLFYSMAAWLPDMYREEGLSAASAGGVLSIALIVGLPLGLGVGVAAERLHDQRPIALATFAFTLTGWLGVLFAPTAASWLWAALLGCGFGIGFPFVLTLMVLRAPDVRHAAELSGMAQSVGYTVAALAPVAVGGLHDLSGSWTLPLIALTVGTAPMLALALAASRRGFVGGGARVATGGPAAAPAAERPH
jgi:MFS transporter, CP family, cyanate transporter